MPTVVLVPSSTIGSGGLVAYVHPDGTVYDLDDREHIYYTRGSQGLGLPPLDVVRSSAPYTPGTRVRRVRTLERELHLPFALIADSFADLRIRKQVLHRALWSSDAEGDEIQYGRIRFTLVSGDVRETRALYIGGLEGDTNDQYVKFEQVVVSFLCPDAWFEDTSDEVVNFTVGGASLTWFGREWFPFTLAGSRLIDSVSIDNTGDIEAWPIWTLTGPAVDPTFVNMTTGARLVVPYTVPSGSVLTIDTRPGFRRVVDQSGNSLYGLVGDGSVLWSLARGLNVINVSGGGTTSTTSLVMNYRRRFLSA